MVIKNKSNHAFTIVELLVVIVVIGILAAITIVSYSGIANRANIAAVQSELSGASKKLAMYYAQNGFYPTTLDANGCPSAPQADTSNCIKFGGGTTYTYTYKTPTTYELLAVKGTLSYRITDNSSSVAYDPNWITIGTQSWAKANINAGTMVQGNSPQTYDGGNGVVQKYCYNNNEYYCNTYGGLYQWSEAMNYTNTEGARGICPLGSHVPSDNDWKVLEKYLGMSQAQADSELWRGTNEGTKLKLSGSSGLNFEIAGYRYDVDGSFLGSGSYAFFWTSTGNSGSYAYSRQLHYSYPTVHRDQRAVALGYYVRCLKN